MNEDRKEHEVQATTPLEVAIKQGATADQIERLLDLQMRMDQHRLELMREKRRMDEQDRQEAARLAFLDAMVQFRGRGIVVPKTKLVQQVSKSGGAGPSFRQSEYDVVSSMISGPLAECGLSYRHDVVFGVKEFVGEDGAEFKMGWVTVTAILSHRAGHEERLTLEGPADSSGAKNPLQEMQSSASFLKRQALLSLTGTATGGEDDESLLRGKASGGDHRQRADTQALMDAGNEASEKGVVALTNWWGGLTAGQRSLMSKAYPGWRSAASAADKKAGNV